MGESRTGAEFSGKINRWVRNVAELPVETERRNRRTAEMVMGAAVASETGGDSTLSRANKGKGARVSVSTKSAGKGVTAVSYRGPLPLVENPVEPHLLGAGRGRTTTRGGRSAVQGLSSTYNLDGGARLHYGPGPNDWATGPFIHPGTKGKGAWRRARTALPPLVVADAHKAMVDTARDVF